MTSENDGVSAPLNIEKCSLILVDVAGTTTSISFVKDTLFPFAVKELEAFLKSKWEDEEVKKCISELKEGDTDLDVAAAVKTITELTNKNSDKTALKTIQGLIYKMGYESGDLKAHVFDDVAEAFETWAKSRSVAIYSTGSIESQKQLFTHTVSGDLSAHISKYFDQSIGVKTKADSYKKIAKEADVAVEEIVFITDNVEEAKAAKLGNAYAVLISRDGNEPIAADASKEFTVIKSFKELILDKASKRKNAEEAAPSEAPPAKVAKTELNEEKVEVKETIEKEESMEVDATPTESKSEEPICSAPEKTETKAEKTEDDPKPTETSQDSEMKDVEEKKEEAEVKAEEPETTTKDSEEPTTSTEETKTATEETKPTETEPAKVSEEAKVAEVEKTNAEASKKEAEAKPTESSSTTKESKSTETPTEEPKTAEPTTEETKTPETTTEEIKTTETTTVEPKPAADTTTTTEEATTVEPKPAETTTEEAKPTETTTEEPVEAKAETEVKENGAAVENGDAEKKPTENGSPDEKENKSELANGVENGKSSEADEKKEEASSDKKEETDTNKTEEIEVKVKKLEESTESKAVSVEV